MTVSATIQRKQESAYITYMGYFDERGVRAFMQAATERVEAGVQTIHVMFHSLGGSATASVALYTFLRALPVHTVSWNIGTLKSSGLPVFLGAAERYASPGSTFTLHGAVVNLAAYASYRPKRNGIPDGLFWERDLRRELAGLVASNGQMAHIYRERTRLSEEEIPDLLGEPVERHPVWALERGVIHGIQAPQIPRGAWHRIYGPQPAAEGKA